MGWTARDTYWTGLQPLDSQVADLETEVDGLEGEVAALEGEVVGLEAEVAAAVAKLVTVSDWVDLTATITTACAGAAASDPDSLAAGLTVTSSTGTFDGATVDCNSFAWTTHTTINDGHSETLNYDLGTIASLIPGYDPATHGVQLEACLVAGGTLNSTQPLVVVLVAANGTPTTTAPAAGWSLLFSSTSSSFAYVMSATGSSAGFNLNAGSVVARGHTRYLPSGGGYAAGGLRIASVPAVTNTPLLAATDTTRSSYTASDKLLLCIGQGSTTAAAISGLKIRFRVRTFEHANLDLSDLDLGVQA